MYFIIYQLALVIPGISPLEAFSLKHNLHSPKYRITDLDLPQLQHLRMVRVEYFGFLFDFSINAFLAINLYYYSWNFIPNNSKARLVYSGLFLVNVILTCKLETFPMCS